ncbi:terminase large subunit [Shewanella sp. phage 1/4]|uniref:terminase large subunit n=1 Tax=Shewanella phage 1/4 TaxID=1458859 RepID=UPI0004F88520|nr:terminase large subunit [Shewanella sp. phage 1/4]AHK11206.1 terminase large subunit [Shewanella sp. phage 1/4]
MRTHLNNTNWNARAKGANYLLSGWFQEVDRIPSGGVMARGYDLAATERSQVNKHPDATTSCKMLKHEGYYYIIGNYHESFYDDVEDVYGRVCKRVGDRDNVMLSQAKLDGDECTIVLPVDPASAGKQVYLEMSKFFTGNGFRVKKDPVAGNKSKLTRFLPFATAAENGLVKIVRNTFDDKTYLWIMKELEAFNGERSTSTKKDDFPDCISTVFNYLCTARSNKAFTLPTIDSPSLLSHHKSRIK